MTNRYYAIYAIRDNKIVTNIDICPFSKEAMDKFCKEQGFDGWFELTPHGVLILVNI